MATKVVEVAKKRIDSIEKSRTFEPAEKHTPARKFFIFRHRGDSIEGILHYSIVNYRRNSSYPITLDSGETIEIFGNKLLHRIIKDHDLVGKRVRIIYIGRQAITRCRPRKIYRVYEITGFEVTKKGVKDATEPKS